MLSCMEIFIVKDGFFYMCGYILQSATTTNPIQPTNKHN